METDAQRRAQMRYRAKLDELRVKLPKEEGTAVRARAEALGLSLSAYVRQLIRADMQGGASCNQMHRERP